jgi:hypothetical protein
MGQGEIAIAAMRRARAVDAIQGSHVLETVIESAVGSWWQNHPELPNMLAAVQKLADATRGDTP